MTSYVKDKKDEILKLFVDICNENNYWYSLDDLSLLSFVFTVLDDHNIPVLAPKVPIASIKFLEYLNTL